LNFFPKPPTDNLYKFLAVTGTWLMAFVTIFIMYLGYINHEIKKISIKQDNYYFHKNTVNDINRRLSSIKKGEIKRNVLDWTIISDGSIKETTFLNAAKKRYIERIKQYESKPRQDYNELFKLVKATGFLWVVYLIIAIAVFCFYFGFRYWYSKVQKLSDISIQHDINIKKLTIEKMKQEIALTKKSSRTCFARP